MPRRYGTRVDDVPTTFDQYRARVLPEWLDFNGHFNAGYYAVAFDLAVYPWLEFLGLTDEHRERHDATTYGLEAHITYERELGLDDQIRITTQLLDHDEKRVHAIHLMYHATTDDLIATNEFISMHITRSLRRSSPMAPELLSRVAAVAAAHSRLPIPPQVGRVIGLRAGRPDASDQPT